MVNVHFEHDLFVWCKKVVTNGVVSDRCNQLRLRFGYFMIVVEIISQFMAFEIITMVHKINWGVKRWLYNFKGCHFHIIAPQPL